MTRTGRHDITNPRIAFSVLVPPTIEADNATAIGFMDLADGDIALNPMDEPSTWSPKVPAGALFLADPGSLACPAGSAPPVKMSDAYQRGRYSCAEAVRIAAKTAGVVPLSGHSLLIGSWHYTPQGCLMDLRLGRPRFNTNPNPPSSFGWDAKNYIETMNFWRYFRAVEESWEMSDTSWGAETEILVCH